MSGQHTSLPWSAYGGDLVGPDGFTIMNSAINLAISPKWQDANPTEHWGSHEESHREMRDGEGEANLDLILRAVNAHADLLQTAKALQSALNGVIGAVDIDPHTTVFTVSAAGKALARVTLAEILEQAGAAIAKAEAR